MSRPTARALRTHTIFRSFTYYNWHYRNANDSRRAIMKRPAQTEIKMQNANERMAAKRRQRRNITKFVCRSVCSAYIKASVYSYPIFPLNLMSELRCAVSSGCWTHFSLFASDPSLNFVAVDRDFIMHIVCVCWRVRGVCVPAASTTRLIFAKMDPFLCRERTQTLACSRSSAVRCCCSFFYSNYCRTTQQEISSSMEWDIVNVLHEQNRTEHRHVHWVDH